MLTVKEILDSSDQWQIVSLCAKAIHVVETTIVGAKRLHLAHAAFADVTGSILVDLWEDQIALVKPGNVYRLTKLQVRIWAGEKKLTSTRESLFTSIADENLQNVRVSQGETHALTSFGEWRYQHNAAIVLGNFFKRQQAKQLAATDVVAG